MLHGWELRRKEQLCVTSPQTRASLSTATKTGLGEAQGVPFGHCLPVRAARATSEEGAHHRAPTTLMALTEGPGPPQWAPWAAASRLGGSPAEPGKALEGEKRAGKLQNPGGRAQTPVTGDERLWQGRPGGDRSEGEPRPGHVPPRPLTPEVAREGDADAGINMAARGPGAALVRAAVVLGLVLLWAGPAGARVHHLTLKVRSAPPPSLLARLPAALGPLRVVCGERQGRPGPARLPRPGLSSPRLRLRPAAYPWPFALFVSLWALPLRLSLPGPCCVLLFLLFSLLTHPFNPHPCGFGRLFVSRGETVWKGPQNCSTLKVQMFHVLLKARDKAVCDKRGLNVSWREASEGGLGLLLLLICTPQQSSCPDRWLLILKGCVAVLLVFQV